MSNESLREFWRGYRNAKIQAYLMMLEHRESMVQANITDGESEQFIKGYQAGIDAMSIELSSLIEKDNNI